jgi:hypothetical protein
MTWLSSSLSLLALAPSFPALARFVLRAISWFVARGWLIRVPRVSTKLLFQVRYLLSKILILRLESRVSRKKLRVLALKRGVPLLEPSKLLLPECVPFPKLLLQECVPFPKLLLQECDI